VLQRAEDGQEAGVPHARSAQFLVSSLGVQIFQRSVGPSIALSAMPSFRALDFSDDLAIFATVFGSEYDYFINNSYSEIISSRQAPRRWFRGVLKRISALRD